VRFRGALALRTPADLSISMKLVHNLTRSRTTRPSTSRLPKAWLVMVGCAHAGVVNTLDCVSRVTGQGEIRAILGGMHLLRASRPRIQATMKGTKEIRAQDDRSGPLHRARSHLRIAGKLPESGYRMRNGIPVSIHTARITWPISSRNPRFSGNTLRSLASVFPSGTAKQPAPRSNPAL
jgi:hypothetical protein